MVGKAHVTYYRQARKVFWHNFLRQCRRAGRLRLLARVLPRIYSVYELEPQKVQGSMGGARPGDRARRVASEADLADGHANGRRQPEEYEADRFIGRSAVRAGDTGDG